MAHTDRPTVAAWLALRPFPVLLGTVLGFVACCLAGRWAATQQPYDEFVRFHQGIAPDSHFYPTFSQLLNLARSHVRPDTTLVIVGGNSVMQGVGQTAAGVWTRALQQELGDRFVVLNLAMRGGAPNEFGALVAEKLAAEGVPLLYVTGTVHQSWGTEWDGTQYRYLFWDAWGKGLLPAEPKRDAWLSSGFAARYEHDEPMQELRRRGWCDGVTYAADLWNFLAHEAVSTVWTPPTHPKFWQPRAALTDPDPGDRIQFEARHRPASVAPSMKILRRTIDADLSRAVLSGEQDDLLRKNYELLLPDVLRDRTLLVLRFEGAFYRSQLSAADQEKYAAVYDAFARLIESTGLRTQIIGRDWTDRDYYDLSHLSEQGGRRLAQELAPSIRKLSDELYSPTSRSGAAQP